MILCLTRLFLAWRLAQWEECPINQIANIYLECVNTTWWVKKIVLKEHTKEWIMYWYKRRCLGINCKGAFTLERHFYPIMPIFHYNLNVIGNCLLLVSCSFSFCQGTGKGRYASKHPPWQMIVFHSKPPLRTHHFE